ncbi:MAG: HAD family hydrolase [Clostridiales bacterium]|nr:HAD family hydrolase [Clostridiales bacterium]
MTKIKAVFFDLDGTLLPMDQDVFVGDYFNRLGIHFMQYGYDPQILIKNVLKGTMNVIKNDGEKTNEKVFWEFFVQTYGEKMLDDVVHFDEFYANEFDKVQAVCGYTPKASELITTLKQKNIMLILATNPIFPAIATHKRIRWAGLDANDFSLITTYENTSYCKPNPRYYVDILDRFSLKPEECVMVGNDVGDDMVAKDIGMEVFLLTDCLINKNETDITIYPNGTFDDLERFLLAKIG